MGLICCIAHFDEQPVSEQILADLLAGARHRTPYGVETLPAAAACLAVATVPASQQSLGNGIARAALARFADVSLCADVRLDARDELIDRMAGAGQEIDACLARGRDADLLLAAWLRWGEDCVHHLLGDFAFVVWDARARRLFAARDVAGVKPLCFALLPSGVTVASEAQQLLRHPGVRREFDELAIALHLVNRGGDDERTFFRAIRQLVPGHALSVAAGEPPRTWRYWHPEDLPLLRFEREEEYALHFRQQFDRAVSDRLRGAEAGAAVLMSGGLDSTSVAAVASQQLGAARLRVFSYRFDRYRQCDEGEYIEAMASTFGLRVENLAAEKFPLFGGREGVRCDRETPFRGWEPPLRYVLEQLRASGTRILLTGHGGDNAPRGSAHLYADLLWRRPWRALGDMWRHARAFGVSIGRLLRVCVLSPLLRRMPGAYWWRRLSDRLPHLPPWLHPELARRTELQRRLCESSPGLAVSGGCARRQILGLVLPWGPVARAVSAYDRMACRFGVEPRHPFLDRRVVEAAVRCPPEQLFHQGWFKSLVRRALPELPAAVRQRHWKTSFRPYLNAAMRVETWMGELLDGPLLSAQLGFIEPQPLRLAMKSFLQGAVTPMDHPSFAVTLELWLQQMAPESDHKFC